MSRLMTTATLAVISYHQQFPSLATPERLGVCTRPPQICKDTWKRIVYHIQFGERLNYVQLTHKGAEFSINLATNSDVWTKYLTTLLALYIDVSAYKIGNSKAELSNLSKLVHSLSTQIKIPQVVLVFANSDLIQLTGDELKKVSPSILISWCTLEGFDTAVDQVVDAYEASISKLPRKSARNV